MRGKTLTPASVNVVATAVRSFGRYLQLRGIGAVWIAAVPRAADWRLARIPRVLTDEEVDALLASFDRTRPQGRRDYAIAQCLLGLGLRASEVAGLKLADVDWRAGILTLPAGKTRRASRLPLPASVARALADYLRYGRPKTSDRALFVSPGLILPFFDIQETFLALRAALGRLSTSGEDADRRRVYERFLDWGSWTMNSPDGPLWFRDYAAWSDGEGEARMPALLSSAGVQRFVVGHTVQKDGRIHVRFGGTVFLIDSGMLNSYASAGRASALELAGGVATAIYPGEPRRVIWEPVRKAADASHAMTRPSARPLEAKAAA